MYDFKKVRSKRRISPEHCLVNVILISVAVDCSIRSSGTKWRIPWLAALLKGPHHPTATGSVGMKDLDNKPRLTQNGGHQLLD